MDARFRRLIKSGSPPGNTPVTQDHDNAAALANGLGALPGIRTERLPGATNAVYFQVSHAPPLSPSVAVLVCSSGERQVRVLDICCGQEIELDPTV